MTIIRWVAVAAVVWAVTAVVLGVLIGKVIAAANQSTNQATEDHEPCPIINLPNRSGGVEPHSREPSRSLRR